MELEEKKLSSEEIFDGVAIHLFRDEILLPNGNKGVRLSAIPVQYAFCLLLRMDRLFLLISSDMLLTR